MDCMIDDCSRPEYRRRLCAPHYRRLLRHGDPLGGSVYRGSSEGERFRHIGWTSDQDCWIWNGGKNVYGYGQLSIRRNGRKTFKGAHRVSYEVHVGPIPEGLQIDHACHNGSPNCAGGVTCRHRACVNPGHLRISTIRENISASTRRIEYITAKTRKHPRCRAIGCARNHHGNGWCVTHGRRALRGRSPHAYRIGKGRLILEIHPPCL